MVRRHDGTARPGARHQRGAQVFITWAHDSLGRCIGTADPDSGVNLSPDCGLIVAAILDPLQENPQLASSLQVGVVDQARGYELLTATEQALQRQETQLRAKQVEDAAKNADAPQL